MLLRALLTLTGILLAVLGGVIAYRAAFIAPPAALVITDAGTSELPDYWRITLGLVLLVSGACLAFFAARTRRGLLRPPAR